MSLRPFALLCALALPAAPAAAAIPTLEEMLELPQIGDVSWSADGRAIVYTVSEALRDTSAKPSDDDPDGGWLRKRRIEWLDLATGRTRTLAEGDGRPGEPRVSGDGAWLGYVRRVEGKPQLRLLPLAGGESHALDLGGLEPGGWRFSPDGRSIAFLATPKKSESEKASDWQAGGAYEWNAQYRNSRVYVVPVEGGEPRAVTPDSLHASAAEWSPDGRWLAVFTSSSADPYFAFNLRQVRVVPASGEGGMRTLPRDADGYATFAWSPDSRTLACVGLQGGLSNWNAIHAWDPATGRVRNLAPDRERTFEGITWTPDSRAVIAVVARRTRSVLERFPLAGGAVTTIGRPLERNVNAGPIREPRGGRLLMVASAPDAPPEAVVFDPATRKGSVVTHVSARAAGWTMPRTRLVTWTSPEGTPLEGLLTESVTRVPGQPAPLLVMPHGGPDSYSGEAYSPSTNTFAWRGYSVFRPNYRGGTAYGFDFYAANRGRFGTIEQMDIEAGVDALIASHDADAAKLFYGGWSWGGYLTAWTIGHVQRYRAAVVGAGVNDPAVSYSLGDINRGISADWEYQGDPWRNREGFDRATPIRYAKDMRTPTLILHGESDDRVPFVNGVELHRALEDMGVETRFVAYPREPHGFMEPAHLLHRQQEWLRWYDTHGGAEPARP